MILSLIKIINLSIMNYINKILSFHTPTFIILFFIVALILVLIISFYLENAKKMMGINMLYLAIAGIFIGIVGLKGKALGSPFYVYMVVLCWNLIAGIIHMILSGKILKWPATESFGWRILLATAIVMIGFATLLSFMKMVGYNSFLFYNLSAVTTFYIPILLVYTYETYLVIPPRIYLAHKPWMYNRSETLELNIEEISNFLVIRYRLTSQTGHEFIDSLPLRAPASMKLGSYFNATLEDYKVTQDRYTIEVKDKGNNYLGWYFFLSDGKTVGQILDPNKTFSELGLTKTIYFGRSTKEEIENLTREADRDGKSYLLVCKREQEYKSQLLKP
jgi:hypothetical protein